MRFFLSILLTLSLAVLFQTGSDGVLQKSGIDPLSVVAPENCSLPPGIGDLIIIEVDEDDQDTKSHLFEYAGFAPSTSRRFPKIKENLSIYKYTFSRHYGFMLISDSSPPLFG